MQKKAAIVMAMIRRRRTVVEQTEIQVLAPTKNHDWH